MLRLCTAVTLSLVLLTGAARSNDAQKSTADKPRSSDQVLRKTVDISFHQSSLNEALRALAAKCGENFVIDVPDVQAAGADLDKAAITLQLQGVELRDALETILKPSGLTYEYAAEQSVIKITGADTTPLFTETYSVVDLVVKRIAGGSSEVDREALQSLVRFLTSSIEPDSWTDAGGRCAMAVSDETVSLVIRQTPETHDKLREVLDQMRRTQDEQVLAEIKVIKVPALDLVRPGSELLRPHTVTDSEQAAWNRGEHRWSDAPVLQWAKVTIPNGEEFRMSDDTTESSMTWRATVSEDRLTVTIHLEDVTRSIATTVSIRDGKLAMIPLSQGRIPVVENGQVLVVVIEPRIKVVEEEEELLGAVAE